MRRARVINIVFFVIGVAALAVLVVYTGPDRIADGLGQVGWAFGLVCLAHLGAITADSIMLWACAGRSLPIHRTLRASLAGHGINEATPLAKLGEVTKFTLLSESISGDRAASALIVQNITMFVAGCMTVAAGSLLTVWFFPLSGELETLLALAAGVFFVLAVCALAVFRFGIGAWPFRVLAFIGVSEERIERWRASWADVEEHWQHVTRDRRAMAINWSAALVSRGFEIAQAAIILSALGSDHVAAAAVMSVASFQLILWATSFVPLQMGSHEAGAYALFAAVGLSPNAGLLLELVRKLRRVVFVALGVTILGLAAWRRRGNPTRTQ